jgi:hypothetical protein
MSVNLIPGEWNDIVNELGRGQTPFKKNNDVGTLAFGIGVNLSRGDWKSRLDKPSPPARTDEKFWFLKPA